MSLEGSQTKYQLCRMLLINAGTNKHVPSARITAIDPRGGAAVLGDNGVGKTTTLRILPLFFGHLPSQIVAASDGQEAMIRFVIPTDASAIAFEYQRGSNAETDLRLAVIRRRSEDPDNPFYRIYKSGYRQELFVADGRFLSDEETQAKAIELGVQGTSKLTTADYRSVILYTPATSKDREKLRRYGVEYSFGPRKLDNLDRVVAAMVKKHISFPDIVQVAVGLVQHDLGQGAERAKLTFKQGKGPIERWLNNRQACLDAFRLVDDVATLESDISAHAGAETRFRAIRADVAVVHSARKSEAEQLVAQVAALTDARKTASADEQARKAELNESASEANRTALKARGEHERAQSTAQDFVDSDAEGWERKEVELPALKVSLQTARDQLEAAEAKHQEANLRYTQLESETKTRANEQALELEQSKQGHRDRERVALEQIGALESVAIQQCEEELAASREQLELAKDPLLEQKGTWEGRKATPAASAKALAARESANERLQAHMEAEAKLATASAKANDEFQAAQRAFQTQENTVGDALNGVRQSQERLDSEQRRLTPPEGSLLAALRASPDEGWRKTLAKVIDPVLIGRDDLEPELAESDSHLLYGWHLNVAALPSPEWADLEGAQRALEAAQERLAASQVRLQGEREKLAEKAKHLERADGSAKDAQASLAVSQQHGVERRKQLDEARLQVEAERKNAVATAEAELSKINAALAALAQQRKTVDGNAAQSKATVKVTFDKQRAQARQAAAESIKAIDTAVANVKSGLEAKLREIQQQLKEHLSKEGVDVTKLDGLRTECKELKSLIDAREDHAGLVKRWKTWLEKGGFRAVEALRGASIKAAADSSNATKLLAEHAAGIDKAERAHQDALGVLTKRQDQVQDDVETLDQLDDLFGDYLAMGVSVIDPKTDAKELRSRVRAIHAAIDQKQNSVAKLTATLRQKLTARNSSVKEFVEATLGDIEDGSPVRRGAALSHCYKQIGSQVVNDVNITLKTLLANIDAFQKAIHAFEREVAAFNKRLQAGLTSVKCFERVEDLHLDVVTNFEGLGFYKKLSKMNDVVRRHANEEGKDYTRELPPEETALALADLMTLLGPDGNVEVNLAAHITLKGSVTDNGQRKEFKRANQLENISSEGLTSLVLITLMTALLNTIRGDDPVHVPWITDEVGRFDPKNFVALMERLRDNRIDVVTASPELGPAQQAMFAQRYIFEDRGIIRTFRPRQAGQAAEAGAAS